MSYSIKHQVFVSSTFTDLVAERAEVIQAIWELDCIPTGMEAFVASNESQWDVIKRVIDECDYYVLILGGRYGSLTKDGISYTEKEYRYAKELGIPVLAFTHGSPEEIAVGKTETSLEARAKLVEFRTEVMHAHPIRSWQSAAELGAVVSRSLVREVRVNPRSGWIRNDGSSPISLLEKVNRLTEENKELRDALEKASLQSIDDTNLESGMDRFSVTGFRWVTNSLGIREYKKWKATLCWDDLFKDLGPALINESTEAELKQLTARFSGWAKFEEGEKLATGETVLQIESWNEVLVQLRALGLITQGTKKRPLSDRASYWKITPKGDQLLLGLLARKKQNSVAALGTKAG